MASVSRGAAQKALMRLSEAVLLSGLTKYQLKQAAAAGDLSLVKVGKIWFVGRKAFEQWHNRFKRMVGQ